LNTWLLLVGVEVGQILPVVAGLEGLEQALDFL
jgi:hypothetical protein